GLRIEARHEGRRWLRTYVGAGLKEWAGVLRRRDGRLTQGSRLQLRLRDAERPAPFSLALRSIVRRDPKAPASAEGLALTRTLPAKLRVGERCELSVELAGEGPLPSGLALEL
ncbi:MAG TPA: hypothetical protein DEA08_36315, partial [Planctomycetes bacterium]|nr:hypothetical protein [Planctomycetota bacterium]